MKKTRGYGQFNFKRRIKRLTEDDWRRCIDLAGQISYGGNPEHKKNPGNFGLTPPSSPRSGKSLCDVVGIFSKRVALERLQAGLRRGLVSERYSGEWPQNIWSVTEDGHPLEAQLENPATGAYHGYPMPPSDPLGGEVINQWNIRDEMIRQWEERDDQI